MSGNSFKSNRDKAEISIILAFFAAFNAGFFFPLDFYLANIPEMTEIVIPVQYIVTVFAAVSIAVFLILFLICFFTKGKVNFVCRSFVFAVSLASYIQGSFLSIGLGELDGRRYQPGAGKIILNIIFWAAVISAVLVLHKKFPEMYGKISSHIAAALIVIQMITVSVSFFTVDSGSDGEFELDLEIVNVTKNMCSYIDWDLYSSKENVIIILADEYDSFCFDEAVKICPEAVSEFDGFTYYTNTVGSYSTTKPSVAYITTGNTADVSLPYENDLFFSRMKERYKTAFYGVTDLFEPEIFLKYADNYVVSDLELSDMASLGKVIYRIAAYKCAPEIFKEHFWIYSGDFYKVIAGDNNEHKRYDPDNLEVYNNLAEELTLTEEKCFKIIYMFGLHDPRNITADLERADDWSISGEEQAVAVNKILNKYFAVLKSSGVYDNSEILLLADHGLKGNEQGKYPLLMYKPSWTSEDGIKISNAPISHGDLYPTLIKISGGESEESTIFDIEENQIRERYFYSTQEYITGNIKE